MNTTKRFWFVELAAMGLGLALFALPVTTSGQQMEEWAEEHAERWQEWAERFEGEWEQWAAGQEKAWEDWAERYAERWEDWGREMEGAEMDPDKLRELVDRNMEMLGRMPIQQLIEKAMESGRKNLDSAPWESLDGLQDMMADAIEKSLADLEDVQDQEDARPDNAGDVQRRIERMQAAIRQLERVDRARAERDANRNDNENDNENDDTDSDDSDEGEAGNYREALERYRGQFDSRDEDARRAVKAYLEAIEKSRASTARESVPEATAESTARRDADRIKMELEAAMRASGADLRERAMGTDAQKRAEAFAEAAQESDFPNSRRIAAMERARRIESELAEREQRGGADTLVRQLYKELEAERAALRDRENELAELRRQVEALTRSVKEMRGEEPREQTSGERDKRNDDDR